MTGAPSEAATARPWRVMRQDDNGNRYLVNRYLTRTEAEREIARLESSGHKQFYWIERELETSSPDQ